MSHNALRLAVALMIAFTAAADAQERPAQGTRYAVLVAVREYPKAKLSNLRFAENDAQQLAEVLLASGYKEENVIRLTLSAGGQEGQARYLPTGENIRRELRVLLGGLGPQDSILVALSGHGVQFKGEKESYFCPADADLQQTDSLLAISEIYGQLKACPARVKVLLVDACRNDPAIAASRGPRGVELEAVGRPQEVELPMGIAALFSCASGQQAWEDNALRHGVFFNFVIAGLKGAADLNMDGKVSYDELSSYSIAEVKRHARLKLGELQTPQQKGEFEGEISLVELARPEIPPPLAVTPFDAKQAAAHQQAWAKHLRKPVVATNAAQMKFSLIPPGEFWMGSPESDRWRGPNETQHYVRITKPFYLSQTEVTRGQFRAFVESAKYHTEAERDGSGMGFDAGKKGLFKKAGYNWRYTGWEMTDDHPATNLTWNDAQAYCTWLSGQDGRNYRLPTEAEWEFACRGGTQTPFYYGGDVSRLPSQANVADRDAGDVFEDWNWTLLTRDDYVFTAPVAKFEANPFGLFDMYGNVEEWCSDWYGERYYDSLAKQTTNDPQGSGADQKHRVLRGGSWAARARTPGRSFSEPNLPYSTSGFRCVQVP